MQEIIDQFGGYLYQLGYGNKTRRCLCAQAGALLAYCQVTDVREITQVQIKDFTSGCMSAPANARGAVL